MSATPYPTELKETASPMRRNDHLVRTVALAAVLAAALAGCAGAPGGKPDAETLSLLKGANTRLQSESFHSSGTTTAFAGAQ